GAGPPQKFMIASSYPWLPAKEQSVTVTFSPLASLNDVLVSVERAIEKEELPKKLTPLLVKVQSETSALGPTLSKAKLSLKVQWAMFSAQSPNKIHIPPTLSEKTQLESVTVSPMGRVLKFCRVMELSQSFRKDRPLKVRVWDRLSSLKKASMVASRIQA